MDGEYRTVTPRLKINNLLRYGDASLFGMPAVSKLILDTKR